MKTTTDSLFETMEHSPYASWCSGCCIKNPPVLILTGFDPYHVYPCDHCGHVTNLAMIKKS